MALSSLACEISAVCLYLTRPSLHALQSLLLLLMLAFLLFLCCSATLTSLLLHTLTCTLLFRGRTCIHILE
jgi:hypothetical protein